MKLKRNLSEIVGVIVMLAPLYCLYIKTLPWYVPVLIILYFSFEEKVFGKDESVNLKSLASKIGVWYGLIVTTVTSIFFFFIYHTSYLGASIMSFMALTIIIGKVFKWDELPKEVKK